MTSYTGERHSGGRLLGSIPQLLRLIFRILYIILPSVPIDMNSIQT